MSLPGAPLSHGCMRGPLRQRGARSRTTGGGLRYLEIEMCIGETFSGPRSPPALARCPAGWREHLGELRSKPGTVMQPPLPLRGAVALGAVSPSPSVEGLSRSRREDAVGAAAWSDEGVRAAGVQCGRTTPCRCVAPRRDSVRGSPSWLSSSAGRGSLLAFGDGGVWSCALGAGEAARSAQALSGESCVEIASGADRPICDSGVPGWSVSAVSTAFTFCSTSSTWCVRPRYPESRAGWPLQG